MKRLLACSVEGRPPSVNRYWRHTKQGHHYISQDGKAYKEKLAWMAKAAGAKPTNALVKVAIEWRCKSKCGGGDLDNRLKVILDALEGVAYHDDKQVMQIDAKKVHDCECDSLKIEVWELF